MLSIRTWHTYLRIFIAPSVLFFAATGALQLFSLHEAHGTYMPPPIIEKLGSLHKDQVFTLKDHHEQQPDEGAAAHAPDEAKAADEDVSLLGTVLLKWFFLLVALGLMTSTLLGLWMGLTHVRHQRTGWWLLAVGIVVPVGLVVF